MRVWIVRSNPGAQSPCMNKPRSSFVSRPRRFWCALGLLAGLGVVSTGALYTFRPDLLLDAEFARQAWQADVQYDAVLVDDHVWVYFERDASPPATDAPVLLLHGFTGSKENFLPLAARLGGGQRMILPDLPGWGESSRRIESDYGIDAQVARIERFLQVQKIPRVHLVGHSMGGHIAGVFAATHPERVASLALIDSSGVRFKPNAFALRVMRGETPFNARTPAEFDAFLGELFAKPPFLPPRMRDVLFERNRRSHAFNARVLDSIGRGARAFELEAKLDRIGSPTAVLWCSEDRILDVSSIDTFARIRPAPTVKVMDGCGHMAMMEQPRAFAQSLESHWQAHAASPTPQVASR